MTRLFSHKNRPVHLGSYPLERLSRRDSAPAFQRNTPPWELQVENPDNPHSLANGMREYVNVMDRMRAGPVAPNRAPIPSDLQERLPYSGDSVTRRTRGQPLPHRSHGARVRDRFR
jgi:hypothetical protein